MRDQDFVTRRPVLHVPPQEQPMPGPAQGSDQTNVRIFDTFQAGNRHVVASLYDRLGSMKDTGFRITDGDADPRVFVRVGDTGPLETWPGDRFSITAGLLDEFDAYVEDLNQSPPIVRLYPKTATATDESVFPPGPHKADHDQITSAIRSMRFITDDGSITDIPAAKVTVQGTISPEGRATLLGVATARHPERTAVGVASAYDRILRTVDATGRAGLLNAIARLLEDGPLDEETRYAASRVNRIVANHIRP